MLADCAGIWEIINEVLICNHVKHLTTQATFMPTIFGLLMMGAIVLYYTITPSEKQIDLILVAEIPRMEYYG